MKTLILILISLVGLIHIYFLIQQMFRWESVIGEDKPVEDKPFANFTDKRLTKVLAGNQGLYNGFLAAGMLWGWLSPAYSLQIWTFFLTFIAIAGVYGSVTLSLGGDVPDKSGKQTRLRPLAILFQTVPAIITLICLRIFL
jgi:putative membrane protein